ncbi:MAG TPA: potassium transporter TrkG [Myxococcota bacterium]|nr:potassium transporter TrkG [Myxococcota bacterium]
MFDRLADIRQAIADRSPEGLLVGGFGALIALGTLLLCLPWAHRGSVGFLDALFTATSAVCVTGLVVVDTGADYTAFGQIVILLLIQAGGIGVMSFAGLAFQLLGRRLSLRAQAALSSSMLQREVASEFRGIFKRVLYFVLTAETVGAVLLFVGMLPTKGAAHAAYSAVFHSISAFCNAGFSLYSDSLTGLRGNPLVITAVMILIVMGGIGHPVMVDVWRRLVPPNKGNGEGLRRITLSSRVALWTSALLVLSGFAFLLLFGLTSAESSWSDRMFGALFQSVTARTAGFNTVDIGSLGLAPLFLLVMLMFIGGSPGSCAGGIKTTTFALWFAKLRSRLRGDKSPRLFGRHISGEITRRVSMIIGLAVVWNLVGILLLLATEGSRPGVGMHEVVFEQISAFGTVGLSTGLTPKLSVVGQLWIIVTMFVGRLGPLTLALWMFTRKTPGVRYPEGRVMIG